MNWFRKHIASKIFVWILLLLLVINTLFIAVLYKTTSKITNKYAITQFEERLKDNMTDLSNRLDETLVQKALHDKKAYQKLLTKLNLFVDERSGVQLAYVIAKVDGKDVILALSKDDTYLQELPFTKEQNQALNTNQPIMSAIYSDKWGDHKSYFLPLKNENAVVGIDMDAGFVKEVQQETFILSIVLVIVSTLLGGVAAYFIGKQMAKPIRELVSYADIFAKGDLTREIKSQSHDEIGHLAKSLERMRQSLESIVKTIQNHSMTVNKRSDTLLQSSSELKETSAQVASMVASEAKGAEELAHHVTEVSEMVQNVSNSNDRVHKNIEQMVELSTRSKQFALKGKEQADNISMQMDKIKGQGEETSTKLEHLGNRSKEIVSVVGMISDISSQIHLLSLNASIEAARAGESGKGFAVVANEIQKLAKKTDESIGHIETNIELILKEIDEVIKANATSFNEMIKGSKLIQESGELFHTINDAVVHLTLNLNDMVDEIGHMNQSSTETSSSIQEISAIAEESAATNEEIAASAEQQDHSVRELLEISRTLKQVSKELHDLMEVFKVS